MALRILVTDDNSEYRKNIMELLELEGFKVLEASNGREAVYLAGTQYPDLILCDVDMPTHGWLCGSIGVETRHHNRIHTILAGDRSQR